MDPMARNDTNAKHRSGLVGFAMRLAGGVAAVGCFFAGLWFIFGDAGLGVSLMGLGIVLGVAFGRYPAGAAALAKQTHRISGSAEQ